MNRSSEGRESFDPFHFLNQLAAQRSVRITVAVAGAVLLLAGALLGLTGATRDELETTANAAEPAAPSTETTELTIVPADMVESDDAGNLTLTEGPGPSSQAVSLAPTTTTSQPYWRIKQQEARQRQEQEPEQRFAFRATTTTLAPSQSWSFSGGETTGGATQVGGTTRTTAAPAAATQPATGTGTRTVLTGGQTPLTGVWAGTAKELADYLRATNPSPRFTVSVEELAGYYVKYAAEVGLRADVLWAQMLHETGFGKYGGAVLPEQNNYAGIGATGGPNPGHTFPTAEAGVKGHIAHMVAYAFTQDQAEWTNRTSDPRYDLVSPRGQAKVLADLDGRWAVPGDGYGERIEQHVRAINQ